MEIEDWLCGIAQAETHIVTVSWKVACDGDGQCTLEPCRLQRHTDFAKPNRRPSDYWNNRPESFDEVAAWVRSEAASRTCWSGVRRKTQVLNKSGLPPDKFSRVNIF